MPRSGHPKSTRWEHSCPTGLRSRSPCVLPEGLATPPPFCLHPLHSPHSTQTRRFIAGAVLGAHLYVPRDEDTRVSEGETDILGNTTWLGVRLKLLGSGSWLRPNAGQPFLGHMCPLHPDGGNVSVVTACFETDWNPEHIFSRGSGYSLPPHLLTNWFPASPSPHVLTVG